MATKDNDSLLDSLRRLTGQVAGGTFELARNTATMTAMFGENWLRNTVLNHMEPERLEAMADAGHFLRDARELSPAVAEIAHGTQTIVPDFRHGEIASGTEPMFVGLSV